MAACCQGRWHNRGIQLGRYILDIFLCRKALFPPPHPKKIGVNVVERLAVMVEYGSLCDTVGITEESGRVPHVKPIATADIAERIANVKN